MAIHDITITGDVQNVGLRTQIVGLGQGQDRRGIVYNKPDGSVQVISNGDDVEAFIEGIRAVSGRTDADIEDIESRTLDVDIHLPKFSRVRTDDLTDISDKLDEGITLLDGIRSSNESLVEGQESLVESQKTLVDGQASLVESQESVVEGQESLIDGQASLVESQESLVDGQASLVESQESLVDGQEVLTQHTSDIAESTGELVDQQSELIDVLKDDS